MKNKIISAIMVCSLSLMQVPCLASNAEADSGENAASTSQEAVEIKKEIIAKDDFSKGLSSWEIKSGSGFYTIGKKLVFDNITENVYPSMIVSNDISVDNGEVEFLLNISRGEYFANIFRVEDNKTLYALRFYPRQDKILLLKKVKGGEYREVKNIKASLEYNKNYKVGITLIGKKISVKLDGKDIFTVEDNSLKSGKLGFEGFKSSATVDDIEVFRYDNIEYDVVEEDTNQKEAKVIYVSPVGSDEAGDGSEQKPYKTIEKAKNAAKDLKKRNTPVDVVFSEGVYPISNTISFAASDSGSEKAPIRYIAKEGEKVVFSGAMKLDVSKFEPVDKAVRERLYDSVADKIVQLDLKEQGVPEELINFTALGETDAVGQNLKPPILTLNESRQTIARWPNSGYNSILSCEPGGDISKNDSKEKAGAIYYTESNPSRWQNADNMYVEGFLGVFWHGEWAKINNVDSDKSAINLKYHTRYGIVKEHRWAVVNLLEEIDIPGEWYIDSEKNILYYYPPHELTANDSMEIATLKTNMIDISGAENISFEGIEFTMTADDPTVPEMNSTGGNGIYIGNGSKNITVKDCILSHVGMNGISINSTDVTIDGCIIYDVGFNGIYVGNVGDRKTLTSSNVVIKNCDISDVNRDTGRNAYAGIITETGAVDVQITNNIIHNCKNSAIRYAGNGHQILYNEIYNVMTETSDAGAVYAGRSWAEYGTAVNYNFFHDIGQKNNNGKYPASSIFWDDFQSGGEFSHNISVVNNYSKTSTVKIGGGVDNIVKGNIMVASEKDIIGEDRSTSQKMDWQKQATSTLKLSSVPYTSTEWLAKYPQIAKLLPDIESNGGVLKLKNTITDNLSVDCKETRVANTMKEASVYENNVFLAADESIFVNPEKLDYRVTKAAKEKYNISDEVLDEDFNIDKIGIANGYKLNKSTMNFSSTYPESGSQIERKNAVISWTKASMADDYRYVIATDPDFKNIVQENTTIYQSVKLDNLQLGKKYYWKVFARNNSRQFSCEVEAKNGVMSFNVAESELLDKVQLNNTISRAYEVMAEIVEGNEVGQYKIGTISAIKEKIDEAEALAALEKGSQSEVDMANFEFKTFINNIESMINCGYTTLNLTSSSEWYSNKAETTITPSKGGVRVDFGTGTEVSLMETLSNYNVMCFKTKVATLENTWVAYGLRALDKETALYSQDAYYILIKEDIFELQKHGVVYVTAPNNGKMKAGEWYDMQFGSITTQNGVNMIFKLNGETIFDYLDKNEPQNKPGMFAMFAAKGNVIEVADAETVPNSLYVLSDKILAEVNIRDVDGKTLDVTGAEYEEIGEWNDNAVLKGDNGSKVRTAINSTSSAKWIMDSGAEGNGKLYKVSYYHIPSADGDKNVTVKISGYAGEYDKTIDMSQGEEGYVEIGTFTFIAADYIGRLSAEFIGSGTGSVNISNIKYELVDEKEYSNMLK